MEYNWYRKELKDKYNLLQKLYRTTSNEKEKIIILNTIRMIEICLSKE